MIKFACPHCRAEFTAEDAQQGQGFACTTCGAALHVPASAAPALVRPALAPMKDDGGPGTRVRLYAKRGDAGTFRTTASQEQIYRALEDMIHRLGLRIDGDWRIRGMVTHSNSFFCEIPADGAVQQSANGREVILDLNWRTNIPTGTMVLSIVLIVFFLGLGLVLLILALVLSNQAQTDMNARIDREFDRVRRELSEL